MSALLASLAAALVSAAYPVDTVRIDGVDVDIYSPPGKVVADVLVLPGWDSSRSDWCKSGGLCDEAERRGLRLVMPEMGKSVYAARVYPETKAALKTPPTRAQLVDVIRHLQKERGLLADPRASFVLGRSTGGRGAVLLALDHPEWFRAAAALSGDFDQTAMPKDALMVGAYGDLELFPDRWRGEDNPQLRAPELAVPVYLGHGAKDKAVPPSQTLAFAKALHTDAHLDDDGAHDHKYWRRELPNVFDFFAKAPDNVAAAVAAFDKLKALDGADWRATLGGATSTASFAVDAKGTALVQRAGYLAVFARDGASITCHVWVDDGFAVHMRAPPRFPLVFSVAGVENAPVSPLTRLTLDIADPKAAATETWAFSGQNIVVNLARGH